MTKAGIITKIATLRVLSTSSSGVLVPCLRYVINPTSDHIYIYVYHKLSLNTYIGKGCTLHAIGPKIGALAAHRRSSSTENTGFSFVNCRVEGNAGAVYLGRAWGRFSRIVYSKTYMDNIIIPEGWSDWNDSSRHRYLIS